MTKSQDKNSNILVRERAFKMKCISHHFQGASIKSNQTNFLEGESLTLRTKAALKLTQKAFFIIFKGFSVARTCLRPERARDTQSSFLNDELLSYLSAATKDSIVCAMKPCAVIMSLISRTFFAKTDISRGILL